MDASSDVAPTTRWPCRAHLTDAIWAIKNAVKGAVSVDVDASSTAVCDFCSAPPYWIVRSLPA